MNDPVMRLMPCPKCGDSQTPSNSLDSMPPILSGHCKCGFISITALGMENYYRDWNITVHANTVLDIVDPMTDEEAKEAYDSAESVPFEPNEIRQIVENVMEGKSFIESRVSDLWKKIQKGEKLPSDELTPEVKAMFEKKYREAYQQLLDNAFSKKKNKT